MTLSVEHLDRTIDTLERAIEAIALVGGDAIQHDLYRNAAIKSFELSLETAGKLIRKALKSFSGDPRSIGWCSMMRFARQARMDCWIRMPWNAGSHTA